MSTQAKFIKGKYTLDIPEHLTALENNYNAFNKLMGMFEFSGVFSEKMIDRVYALAGRSLDIKIAQYTGKTSDEYAGLVQDKIYVDFKKLFEIYRIFSPEFVSECNYEFLLLSRF